MLEIGFLYLLIAVESPVSALVRRLMRNPAGLFAVVMIAVTMVCLTMALLLTARERSQRRAAREAGSIPAGNEGETGPNR
ncbi:MAG: hypothetical protein ACKVZ0_22140 [Gemmatimonadales bacterium]